MTVTYKLYSEPFSMKHVMGESSRTKLTNVVDGDIQPNAVDLR
jgi:hypothetical protein